ncbi:phospholipase D-like domain-containing protein [Bacillus sp. Cs-700]|uniref:phospholipase D-like domain-containing protein n=1 Tax=Bacillus sp. Cs-700 TaxID=2589818 RepID=UPI001409BC0A|nr:phospholipase D-like domain-containing protein [Bacillus sp. Cs-700]
MSNKLQDKIVHFVSICVSTNSDHFVERFINFIGKTEISSDHSNWQNKMKLPFDLEYFTFEIQKEADSLKVSSYELQRYLEIAYKMARYQIELQPRISPVWTGPSFSNGIINLNTYNTVLHLIESAKEEVFIVGYNFSFKDESIRKLLRSIENAVERNCRVNILVNDMEKNFEEIMTHWKKEQYQLNLYHWKGSEGEDFTSLHAKLVIIDQQKLLLTSANFSYHGFHKNIETGVVIENHGISRDIWKQYHLLMKDNQMKKAY